MTQPAPGNCLLTRLPETPQDFANRAPGNPAYDRRLAPLCQSVEVKVGEAKTVDLKQISTRDIP